MDKSKGPSVQVVGMAWFRREDYPRVLAVMTDAHKLHATYDEWRKAAEQTARGIESKGLRLVKAELRPDDFVAWCRARGLNVDASARMQWGNEQAYLAATKANSQH